MDVREAYAHYLSTHFGRAGRQDDENFLFQERYFRKNYLPYLPKLKYYSNHHFTKFLTFFGYDMYQHHFANKFYEAVKLNKCIKTLQNKYRKQ